MSSGQCGREGAVGWLLNITLQALSDSAAAFLDKIYPDAGSAGNFLSFKCFMGALISIKETVLLSWELSNISGDSQFSVDLPLKNSILRRFKFK